MDKINDLEGLENIYDESMFTDEIPQSKTYNDKFDNDIYDEMMSNDNTFLHNNGIEYGDIGEDAYLTQYDDAFDEDTDIEELAAQRQAWGTKVTYGLGRIGTKVVSEIAKMPGVVIGIAAGTLGQIKDGITGEDDTDFMQVAFNNPWIKAIDNIEEHIKDEILPVHVKKAVSEGDIWTNLGSMDFWATEGADGIGYILSMLAPGAVINRFNLGAKLLGVNKYNKILAKSIDAEKKMAKWYRPSNKAVNLHTGTVANTVFEAGAEAKSAMNGYRANLEYRLNLDSNDPDSITQEEFDIKIKDESAIGAKVFATNAAILIGPNAIMSKMLWGKKGNKIQKSIFNKNKPKIDGKISKLSKMDNPSFSNKLKEIGIDVAKASGREGFFEEGLQSTAETYFTENPDKSFYDFISGDLGPAYLDMLNTTDGLKAIALGAILGGGMQSYQGVKERKKSRSNTNKLIDSANKTLDSFYELFQYSSYEKKDGEIVYEDSFDPETGEKISKPKLDFKKVLAKLNGLNEMEVLSAQYDLAMKQGDNKTIDKIQDIVTTHLVLPFIVNDNLGIEILKKHLNLSKDMLNLPEDSKKSKDEYIASIIDKATYLKDKYTKFQDIAPAVLDLHHEEATEEDVTMFYNKHSMQYVNLHAQRNTSSNISEKSKKLLVDAIDSTTGFDSSTYFSEKAYRERANNTNTMLNELFSNYSDNNEKVEEIDKKLAEFWNNDKVNSKFKKEIDKNINLAKNIKKNEKIISELINTINTSTSIEELNDIILNIKDDSISSNLEVKNIILKKRNELEEIEAKKQEELKKNNDTYIANKLSKDEEIAKYLEHIKKYFKIGDTITIPNELDEILSGQTAIIEKINKTSITVKLKDGSKKVIKFKKFIDTLINNFEYNTEGGENNKPQEIVYDKASGNVFEKKNQPRIVITNNQKGNKNKKLEFTTEDALSYERNPVNKTGDRKNIEINKSEGFDKDINWQKAIDMIEANDFSDINFLIDNLPLNIKLTDTISAPLETQTKGSQEVFNKTSKELRSTIIKELAQGTKIEDITVEIAGQWNGDLQLEKNTNGLAVENNIKDLFKFSGDIFNIKNTDLFVVNEHGELINVKGDILYTARPVAPGEIYIKIEMANGKAFPLKLNIKKINTEEADLLYELYSHRLINIKEGKSVRISTLPDYVQDKIDIVFKNEIELFAKNKKSKKDITIKDIVDTLIWDGTKSKKTQVRFENGRLLVGNKSYSREEFKSKREEFIQFLTSPKKGKRRNIRFKRRGKTEGINSLTLENRSYLEYLINNNILNTNAVVNEPTFQGQTTMYLNKRTVKVKNRTSKFNKDVPRTFSKNLLGSNQDLHNKLPGLNKNVVHLNKSGSHYIDEHGNEYNRVSSLKDSNINTDKINVYNAAKRGNVVDLLTRDFFNKNITLEEFIKRGNDYLKEQNAKDNNRSTIKMSSNYFTNLFNILEQYKIEFDKRNYTVYSTSNALSGNIKTKGNIAGTVDLLAYDNVKNEWVIIDLKTSTSDRSDAYSNPKSDRYNYKKKDSIQQLTYNELLFQKTGIKAKTLLIMPLVSKANNKNNSEYDSIKMSKAGLFLEVDNTQDLYKILNINLKKDDIKPAGSFDVNNIKDNDASNINDDADALLSPDALAAFGITPPVKPTSPQPVVKDKTDDITLTSEEKESINQSIASNSFTTFTDGVTQYIITLKTFFVLDKTNSKIITSFKKSLRIIQDSNKTLPPMFQININNVNKIWKSRLNVVSLPKDNNISTIKTSDNINIVKLTEEQANNILRLLFVKYAKIYSKDINIINNKYKSSTAKAKVTAIISMLENKGISKEEIKTECGL